ncbi:hypothetical protein [Natroniella sp. ANB-PHB2]|uniref:hypothetical protein n=1 Tax=Natroniella sp. ANB-PHB2 TaxID=3384444 RepID=UPI0038D3D497
MSTNVIYKLEEFFTSNSVLYHYYDLYFTDQELLLIYVGESHRSFLVKDPFPGKLGREKLEGLSLEEIAKSNDKNIIIPISKIKKIKITDRSFFRNLTFTVETNKKSIELYNERKDIDLEPFKEELTVANYPL